MDFHSWVHDLWSPDSEARTFSELPPSIVSRSDRPPSPWQLCKRPILTDSDEGGATRPLSCKAVKGRRPVVSCKTRLICIHQQFQASSLPTLFTYSTPKFCWSRKKWHRLPTFDCTLLCKWHASSPFWNPTRQAAWEIPKGGRPVTYITGFNLGPLVATPAMDAVLLVLGALFVLLNLNGLCNCYVVLNFV